VIGLRQGFRLRVCAGAVAALCVAADAPSVFAAAPTPRVALDPMETSLSGDRFFLTPSGSVPRDGAFAAKLFESYAYLPLLSLSSPFGARDAVSSELYFDVGASYALFGRALLAVDLPFVPFEGGDATERAAVGDLRLSARVHLFGDRHADLGTETRLFLPTGNPAALTSDGDLRVVQLFTVSGRFSSVVYAASLGYLARKRRDIYGSEIGPSLPFSAAIGVDVAGRLQIGPELQGFTPFNDGAFKERSTPVLGLIGAKLRFGSLVLGGAAGPGLTHAPGVGPHVTFSIAWEPEPKPQGDKVATSVAPAPLPSAAPPPPPEHEPIHGHMPPPPPPQTAEPRATGEPPLVTPPIPQDPEEARALARRLFQDGISAYDAGRYDEATANFARAYQIKPHPAVLRNMALSELMQGRREQACLHFKRWRIEAKPKPKDLEQIKDSIEEACR
jgi:hypothetical protein